ncbi:MULTISPECIES: helix-turn-helix domain-containing protein [Clostridium]|jgi:transcriptional regulator with XRE-family HTH domain|uniref:DNA-binding protein n=1 Tax=Clostridium paraputrificum TaxID=29363 RepID=A0A1B8RT38_9CLOT|nr:MULTISPECIES: helix-turn-helix transcriptional regulator [Clostridium]MDB2091419.1 helix-turn-helix transcriptional regulator [Clostridium paraputrificum]MDU3410981.1 helix-turn-helix transcriptional regulator [Clostridium sp.]OBY11936.1 DNA-binding protein [Clostridium paraputrificum]
MNKIKQIRQSQGMTVRNLSDKAKVATSYISELENDKENKKNPTKDIMDRIALALGVTVPEIFY